MVAEWNSVPDYGVTDSTVLFKKRLDKFWSNQSIYFNFEAEIEGTGSRSNFNVQLMWKKRRSLLPLIIIIINTTEHVRNSTVRQVSLYLHVEWIKCDVQCGVIPFHFLDSSISHTGAT